MTVSQAPFLKWRGFDNNGNPVPGGLLFTYASGTSTKLATYTDSTGGTPNTNPIVLNSRSECDIFFTSNLLYKLVLSPANDTDPPTNSFWTEDNVSGIQGSNAAPQILANSNGASYIGGGAQIVSSVSGLRGLSKNNPSKTAIVTGYYSAGDGGGGTYFYNASDTTSSDNGGTIIEANDGGRWYLQYGSCVSTRQFGAQCNWNGTTGQDDTTFIQSAMNWIASVTVTAQESVGGNLDVYTGTLPYLDFGEGRSLISSALTIPGYFIAKGNNAGLIQSNAADNIFYTNNVYRLYVEGINFVGGLNHVSVGNGNTDGTSITLRRCEFHLSASYAVNTFVTGGVYFHLSCNLLIDDCIISKCNKILYNYCDSAIIRNTWAFLDVSNFTASTAAIINTGSDNHSRLILDHFFGVPNMGVQGVNRLANVRWVDNYGSVYANGCRFGGESAGMPIVYHYIAPPVTTPFLGYQIVIRDSWIFSGPSVNADSGVIVLQGQCPQLIEITDNLGPAEVPFIVNISGTVNAAYFTAYTTATSKQAYNAFQIRISNNSSDNSDGLVYSNRIPAVLRPYISGYKQTRVNRVASQSIANGFTPVAISWDTATFDNVGGFAIASPTHLVMPPGANTMRISLNVVISGPANAGIIAIRILNSGATIVGGQEYSANVNSDNSYYSLTADVNTSATDYFTAVILNNTSSSLTLLSASVSLTPLDYVG